MKYIYTILLIILTLNSFGQERIINIPCSSCPSQKVLYEYVNQYDSNAKVSIDRSFVKIRINPIPNISDIELISLINDSLNCNLVKISPIKK